MTTVYKFKAYYTDAGVGTVQDPAPTCTVINMADDSKLADAQATTASTNMPGLYSYEYSGADGLDCVAWFKTTDAGCDVKELASYVSEKITTNLNADVAGVETKLDTVDSNVDAILADTGTDGVKLASGSITAAVIATDAIDAIGAGSGSSAEEIWEYASRTLTQSAASVAATVAGSTITAIRGDTLSAALTGLGALTNYSKIWFTVKDDEGDPDTSAVVQIEKTGGLLRINGGTASTTAGSITITGTAAGDITIGLAAAQTALLSPGKYWYDVQILRSAGTPVSTLTTGTFNVSPDYTKATS